jgi:hypothetical protein
MATSESEREYTSRKVEAKMTDGVGAFKGSMMRQTEKLGDRTRGASFL